MRVVQINTVTGGCTGRIACSIRDVLIASGHECVIAYGRGKDDRPGMYRICSDTDSYIHGALTRIFDSTGLHSKGPTKKFIEYLEEYKPDVIQMHNLHGYYINYKLLFDYFRRNPRIKVFWTFHDCWPFTGHCPYYTFVGCDKWKTGCHHCVQKLHHPTSYVFDRSKRNYEDKKNSFCGLTNLTIVTPSKWLKREVEQSFLKEYKVVCIPNGIPLSVFHPTDNVFRRENKLEDKTVVLGVSSLWAKTKGLDYFIKLSELLPEDRFKVVAVGLSEKQVKDIPAKMIGIRKTDNLDQLVDIYSSADIFINPTSEDNFPTTNIEALACGTPVITFDTGGSPESLTKECGMVVDKDINKLVDACTAFGRKDLERVGACIARSREYDENTCFGRYIELYLK